MKRRQRDPRPSTLRPIGDDLCMISSSKVVPWWTQRWPSKAYTIERECFESSQATRLNLGVGLYFGLPP